MRSGRDVAAGARTRTSHDVPVRQIRAHFEGTTVRVYQAFPLDIANKATTAQTFKPPFKRERMTWIKPSFTWMMYRSGWGSKPGQERVLGIDITRTGFDWALAHSCITHFDAALHDSPDVWQQILRAAPVRVQWDPERTLLLEALPWRTIQIGLRGEAVDAYLDEWLVPIERPYPLSDDIARHVGCSVELTERPP